jgi:hypothetical protein
MAPVLRQIHAPVEVDSTGPTVRTGTAMALPILPILFVLQTVHAQRPMYARVTTVTMEAIAKIGSVIILS